MQLNLISTAMAAVPASTGGQPAPSPAASSLVMLIGFAIIFYFMLWRPQSKRAKEHRQLLNSLTKGDEVVTGGGIIGEVSEVGEQFLAVKIAEGVEIKVQKQGIHTCLPKGTLKAAL